MKLLAKSVDDRYQSALGLMMDLQECLKRWQDSERIEEFALARQDIPIKFNIPPTLIGRDRELDLPATETAFRFPEGTIRRFRRTLRVDTFECHTLHAGGA